MSSKHLSNDISALLQGCLTSLSMVNPGIIVDKANKIVYHEDALTSSNVAIVSGGGSGHEPAFAGFVGSGFLSAAVAGSIFASPSADQVYRCLVQLGSANPDRGILVIIMNYTGDKLHFGMALEKARARGLKVELLVVGDDVGVGRSRSGRIGRRGLAGTVLVQKIAGALAASGASLSEVYEVASAVASNVATVGASLAHVHVPGRVVSTDELNANDEIEIDMGIHNEEGFGRVKTDLTGLVRTLLKQLLDTSDSDRGFIEIQGGNPVVLMVNNLGGLSNLELGAVTTEISKQLLETYNISPVRVICGTYMSSLNGMAFSATLLKVVDDRHVELLDASAGASGWLPPAPRESWTRKGGRDLLDEEDVQLSAQESKGGGIQVDPARTKAVLAKALQSMIESEPEVTKYDTLVGDGDCGLCLKNGAEAVLSHIQLSSTSDAVALMTGIAHVIEKNAIFTNAIAHALQVRSKDQAQKATPNVWGAALDDALRTLSRYTPAKPGDRTVIDTLQPFVDVLNATGNLEKAVNAANKGCETTKGMVPGLGRSVYVGGDEWKKCPDPGAYGLLKFLEGLVE